MANLVSPGYNHSTLINQILAPVAERIIDFKGLNRNTVVEEGEMSDMKNLTADCYPTLSPRKPRGEMELPDGVFRPLHIVRRFDKIGLIAIDEAEDPEDPLTVSFYYDGEKVDEVAETETLPGLSTESQAVAINNIMCFFPQKTCIDITIDGVVEGTYRSLEAQYTVPTGGIDISTDGVESLPISIAKGLFKYDDAVNIEGTVSYYPSGGALPTTMAVNVSCVIEDVIPAGEGESTDTIYLPVNTFIELVGAGATNISLAKDSTITRSMPDLDMVVEWNNRLWGCSSADNTIYASKLGDPSNWQYYQGTGLDSYYAQQGTDEAWTGIAEYSGHLIFFKPNTLTRVYGTAPSNYQIAATKAYGVEAGSSKSVLVINDTVFYKSEVGIMAYQGGVPVCISDNLACRMKYVVAGTEGRKYYASCVVKDDAISHTELYVFDIGKGMWHKEDHLRFVDSCKMGDKVYVASAGPGLVCDTDIFVQEEDTADEIDCVSDYVVGKVLIFNPEKVIQTKDEARLIDPDDPPESYEDIDWTAVFGPFDEYVEEHKIYSKLAMRIKAKGEASATVYISINEGPWEQVEYYERISTKGDFIPIIPRRCDRYSVKIEGKGNCEVKSLTRRVRQGTFGRL